MKSFALPVNDLQGKLPFLRGEHFQRASTGTHHEVFVSEHYVIRLRQENPKLLAREVVFLKEMDHRLIPKIIWSGTVNTSFLMIENRLLGNPLNTMWKDMPDADQQHVIQEIIQFLTYLREQKRSKIYSVQTGKTYANFFDSLIDGFEKKLAIGETFQRAKDMLHTMSTVLYDPGAAELFAGAQNSIVHGDVINHNLLTDGKHLTGILDWELAFYGDPDYDLSRLYYYRECAKAYQEQGIDDSYEAEYMNKLIKEIRKSDLMINNDRFEKKYRLIRAIFSINALYWATTSEAPEKNIAELVTSWNKKGGAKHLHA